MFPSFNRKHGRPFMSLSQAQSEIAQLVSRFERNANAKDADALVRDFYANNAVLLPPNTTPINGAEAIKGFWKGMLEGGAADLALQTTSVDSSGDLTYEV